MDLSNKTAVVLGVADESSIAWGIARALLDRGADVFIGYQQKFYSRVRLLMQQHPEVDGARCDILNDEEVRMFFERFQQRPIDILVHAIAFGPPDVFTDPPSQVRADSFAQTLSISTHSLLKSVGFAQDYLSEWGSVMTLTYQASTQASPFYGMMGVAKAALESCVRYLAIELGQKNVRINAISPGPIETPAAMGEMLAFLRNPDAVDTPAGAVLRAALDRIKVDPTLSGKDDQAKAKVLWHAVQSRVAQECAIQQIVTQEDVGNCAAFLASDYSRKITGQTILVDCGMSTSRLMPSTEAAGLAPGTERTRVQPAAASPPAAANPDAGQAAAVLGYLASAFPGCDVNEGESREEGVGRVRVFTVEGPGFSSTLEVSGAFLELSTDQVSSKLHAWATADVLRDVGGTPVFATVDGLGLAGPGAGLRF